VLAVVAASVGLAEGLVRWLLDPPGRWPASEESPVMLDDPLLGYGLRPGATGQYTAGGHVALIRINARGFRDHSFPDTLGAGRRMLAVGDSFTFGLGVDSTDSWPEQLERMLGRDEGPDVTVANAGIPGYSARQMRQLAEAMLPELRPQVVLIGMNSETYWRVEAPYVYRVGQLVQTSALPNLTIGKDGLYYSRIVKWRWLNRLDVWMSQHFELGAHLLALAQRAYGMLLAEPDGAEAPPTPPTPDSTEVRRRLQPALAEVERMAAVARAAGAQAVVLLINPQREDGSFAPVQSGYNAAVSEFCRAAGIAVVDPLPALVAQSAGRPLYRSPDNYHWTVAAHTVAARALADYLTARGLP
jgi:lysophospholipase L1-like esterase